MKTNEYSLEDNKWDENDEDEQDLGKYDDKDNEEWDEDDKGERDQGEDDEDEEWDEDDEGFKDKQDLGMDDEEEEIDEENEDEQDLLDWQESCPKNEQGHKQDIVSIIPKPHCYLKA
ncbi:hypothetical protein ACA910_011516 [Epithemia clementina (nom. ined.)]